METYRTTSQEKNAFMDMTNEELTELIELHSQRLELLTEALFSLRQLMEAQSQRLDNIDNKLFGLKEP